MLEETLTQALSQLQGQMELREFGVEFLGSISRQYSELGIYIWNSLDYPTAVRQLFAAPDRQGFQQAFLALCNQLTEILSKQDMDASRYLVVKAKEYIDDRYTDPELSLEEVSSYVGLSRSYFCSLFHKVENKTFKIYLMERRIRHAKKLLAETDRKIYEISCAVGCSDAAYFNRVFKRITGLTPLQYRNNSEEES